MLHYDEQIDWLCSTWHASATGAIGRNLGKRPMSWWDYSAGTIAAMAASSSSGGT